MKKKYYVVAAGLGFAQLALFGTVAHGQERPVAVLDEVVVTATRSPKKQGEIGKVVRVITAEQLAKSQGRSLPEVLNFVAGLTLSGSQNAPGSNVSVFTRGAATGNTLILLDGIPVNNASSISGDYDISSIAIDQIERIEVLKGVNSTLYGSDAVAGVINIITKQPGKAFAGSVLATAGSYGSFKQALDLNGTAGKTGVSLNISNLSSDGFSAASGKLSAAPFDKDGFKQQAITAHVKQQLTDQFSVQGNLQLNRNTFDLDAGAFADDPDYTGKNSSLVAGVQAAYVLPKGTLNLIYNQNNVRNQFDNPGTGGAFSRQDNKGKVYYAEAVLHHALVSFADVTAGLNYRNFETSQTYESQSSYGPFNSYLPYGKANNNILSGFSSFFLKAGAFRAEVGGRFNHHSQYGNNLTYTLNPSYVFNGRYKVFASLATAYKAPSLYHLTSQYANASGLDPETTTSYEAGTDLELISGKLTFSASGFIRNTKKIIYFYTDPTTYASEYRNGNRQKDKGFELELTAKPTDKLALTGWYAFVKGRGEDYTGVEADFLLRRPKNTFGATGSYTFSNRISGGLTYKFTGNRLDPFGYPTLNLPQHAYTLLDAYVQVIPVSRVTVFADVKNLFDEGYTEWQGYSTRGRNVNFGLKVTLK